MSVSEYLRRHSTVVRDRERKGLVSVGAAFRYRKRREAVEKRLLRNREERLAWAHNPENPLLPARRRAELLAALRPQG